MPQEWKSAFDEITTGAEFIKNTCLNRGDVVFVPWHTLARDAVARYAPGKLPSFDEIRFASDYFLSKSQEEQESINDRIALVSDIDLFVQMATGVVKNLEKTRRVIKPVVSALTSHSTLTEETRESIRSLSLSPHDKNNILQEIERVERELAKPHPDWDLIKRTIKFLLDFDRKLALDIVPRIIALVQKK